MAIRQLERKHCGSNFGEWHRRAIPSDRTLTDIDGVETSMLGLRLVEQRSPSYVPPLKDNALATLRKLAIRLDVAIAIVPHLPMAAENTQHALYAAQQGRDFCIFAVDGNRSDLRGPADISTSTWSALCASAAAKNIPLMRIAVDREGTPRDAKHVRWLVEMGRR